MWEELRRQKLMRRNDRMTEGRTKQTLNAPLPFYGGGIKMQNVYVYTSTLIQTATQSLSEGVEKGYGEITQ